MKRTTALAIALTTVMLATAAHAASLQDVQAPRGQDVQASRDRNEDIQAPRDRQEELQAPRAYGAGSPQR